MNEPKDLTYRLGNVLDQLEGLEREDALKILKNYVLQELNWFKATRVVDQYDLTLISNYAKKSMTDFPSELLNNPKMDHDRLKALAYLRATELFLNSKELIPFDLKLTIKSVKILK